MIEQISLGHGINNLSFERYNNLTLINQMGNYTSLVPVLDGEHGSAPCVLHQDVLVKQDYSYVFNRSVYSEPSGNAAVAGFVRVVKHEPVIPYYQVLNVKNSLLTELSLTSFHYQLCSKFNIRVYFPRNEDSYN